MATIEERARRYEESIAESSYVPSEIEQAYIAGATEQDRIARQKEKERVMSAVIRVLRRTNYFVSEDGFSEETNKDQFMQCVNAELDEGGEA